MLPLSRRFWLSLCLINCSFGLLLTTLCRCVEPRKVHLGANDPLEAVRSQQAVAVSSPNQAVRTRRSTAAAATTRNRTTSNLLPRFAAPIGNVSAVVGRDVRLVCQVEDLGSHQVAWLKEESGTILSIDTNIITTNYRIFLIPDEEARKWVLHIKDVQESDRGLYQCQINTKPTQSMSGHLEVVVPPSFIEPQTSQVAEAEESANVSIQCKASGHPRPAITWRRDDGQPIKLTGRPAANWQPDRPDESRVAKTRKAPGRGARPDEQGPANETTANGEPNSVAPHQLNDVKSDKLTLTNVDRTMGGVYVCTASNGIPSQVSKRISLYVKFEPKVSIQNKYISVSLNEQLEIDCLIESFPKANTYWSKRQPDAAGQPEARPYAPPRPPLVAGEPVASRRAILHRQRQPVDNSAPASPLRRWPPSEGDTGAADELDEPPGDQFSLQQQHQQLMEKDNFLQQSNLFGKQLFDSRLPLVADHAQSALKQRRRAADFDSDSGEQQLLVEGAKPAAALAAAAKSTLSQQNFITIKQTPVNPYTYKLKLIIHRMQASDFGEYACVSSNSMGQSEAHVIVTRADSQQANEPDEQAKSNQQPNEQLMSDENDFHKAKTGAADEPPAAGVRLRNSAQTSQRVVVYDENYLQTIKNRQLASGIAPGRLQQKLKMKPDRNNSASGRSAQLTLVHLSLVFVTLTLSWRLSVTTADPGGTCIVWQTNRQ